MPTLTFYCSAKRPGAKLQVFLLYIRLSRAVHEAGRTGRPWELSYREIRPLILANGQFQAV
ncbi:hypothetical protein [Paenibacillus albidus]|uniref:hypothetical protein n=1 Tax=Paenibacillus albidus TaxID=2041023 RepID=UPI001664E5E4|nr:hypothetical protein [Paenibacillus albidus]